MGQQAEEPYDKIHVSVLLQEVLAYLQPQDDHWYADATLGLGGHSQGILDAADTHVLGFEWDEAAAELAQQRLSVYEKRFQLIRRSYTDLQAGLLDCGRQSIHGLVADLGVSSLQLDRRERGFSFQTDAPLDMRMSQQTSTRAADLLADLNESELADIFYHYGEEPQARRIARFLVEERKTTPFTTTLQLAELVARAIPRKYHPKKVHVATRVFQALRIAVNRELDNVNILLEQAPDVLEKGARICIITFHSLEDRMVKHFFTKHPAYKAVVKKPVEASLQEVSRNPRSRSARLRVAERV